MGTYQPVVDMKDILRDRSLETDMIDLVSDEEDDVELPTLEDYMERNPLTKGEEDKPLPSFGDILLGGNIDDKEILIPEDPVPSSLPLSKKRQRQAERRRAAQAVEQEEIDKKKRNVMGNALSKIPFLDIEEGQEITPIKFLETMAWVGIASLIGWEAFINSPLFERAAPLAPVVY